MPELEPIKTAASASSKGVGARSSRSRNSSTSRPQLQHVVSGWHLDDHSVYHSNDEHESIEDESDYSEKVVKDENEKAENDGIEETSEVRGGILTERDIEAPPLEKRQTSKSAKDPNLVKHPVAPSNQEKSNWKQGHLERSRRPGKSQKLVSKAEMGGYSRCVVLHIYITSLVVNGRPCYFIHIQRIRNHKRGGATTCTVSICLGLCHWPIDTWTLVRNIWPCTGAADCQSLLLGFQHWMWSE